MAFGTQDEPDEVMNDLHDAAGRRHAGAPDHLHHRQKWVMKHAVNIDLPRATSEPEQPKPQNILFSVTADGTLLPERTEDRRQRTAEPPRRGSRHETAARAYIRGDKAVRYERVAKAMCLRSRRAQDRFNTEPDTK